MWKSSTSQSRHYKYKTPKCRYIKSFRLRRRRIFPIPTAVSRYRIKVKWWSVSLQITGTWSTVYTSCVILRKIMVLILLVSNICPCGNLNIFTLSPIPDVSARGHYMQDLILLVVCMAKHKRLSDCWSRFYSSSIYWSEEQWSLPGVLCSAAS